MELKIRIKNTSNLEHIVKRKNLNKPEFLHIIYISMYFFRKKFMWVNFFPFLFYSFLNNKLFF